MLIWLELATYMENLIKNYSLCLNAQKGGKEEEGEPEREVTE